MSGKKLTLLEISSNVVPVDLTRESLQADARLLADSFTFDSPPLVDSFPVEELHQLFSAGFCRAPLPFSFGGVGLGTEPGSHWPLLGTLMELGRANLCLARVYEGHVNALILVFAFGTLEQQEQAAEACLAGKLFSLWNTDGPRPTRLTEGANNLWRLEGEKAFASAAEHAQCFLMTADKPDGARQMCLLEARDCVTAIDKSSWHPLGMRGSGSFQIAFDGTLVPESAFIGEAGDYYRPPLFLGGALRTSAIHLGGAEALLRHVQNYVRALGRTGNPLLRRRIALIYTAVRSGRLWMENAAQVAEQNMNLHASPQQMREVDFTANATRIAIEKICCEVIQLVTESVGARGLNSPYCFANIIRDLTMFLRQPDPDGCITEVGRYLLADGHA